MVEPRGHPQDGQEEGGAGTGSFQLEGFPVTRSATTAQLVTWIVGCGRAPRVESAVGPSSLRWGTVQAGREVDSTDITWLLPPVTLVHETTQFLEIRG